MNTSTCIFTIAPKNRLSQVRTLLASVQQHHPDADTRLVLCDRMDGCFEPGGETFQTVTADSLGIDRWPELASKYSCLELSAAVKPFAIRTFLQESGHQRVIYLDPDIVVYRPLEEVFELLESHGVVLTPHLTDFLPDDGCLPNNLRILQAGTNNLGFVALRRSERVFPLVDWWCRQLHDDCRLAPAEGVFLDQKWMDLALSCVESSCLLRHPGYNVAWWNLPHRKVTRDHAGGYLVNGEPLRFFHFHGFDPKASSILSREQTRLSWNEMGEAVQSLYHDYEAALAANGHRETSVWPYAYGDFDNEERISEAPRARMPHGRGVFSRSAAKVLTLIRRQRGLVNRFSPRFRTKVKNILEKMIRTERPRPATQPVQGVLPEKKLELGVNVFGFFDVPSGVGEAARGGAACLDRMNIPVHRVAFDENQLVYGQASTARPDPRLAINCCHVNAESTDALQELFGQEPFEGRFNIGCWNWELDEFPAVWDAAAGLYQEIWAPTTFVQQAVAMRVRVPVVRIPLCIRIDKSTSGGRKTFNLPENRPVILCMFDTASIVDRKNPMAAIEAVDRACAAGHDPLLVIKAARTELDRGLANRLLKQVKHVECRIVEGWLDRQQTLSLIEACDLFVSLHRSEGFGLILAEAMAYGKPVVATGYSGNMDFMHSMNSFPVDYRLTTLKDAVGPYPTGARWAEPDVEHAAFLIREILDHPEHAQKIGRRAAEDIARGYSVEAVSELIRKRLKSLGFSVGRSTIAAEPSPAPERDRQPDRESLVAKKVA